MGISGTTGTITIATTGGTIDGLASIALLPQQEATIITDGTNWRTFGLKREVIIGTIDTVAPTTSVVVLLPVGYRYFELQVDQISIDADGNYLQFQLSNDGGTTWIATAGSYYDGAIYDNAATTTAYQSGSNNAALFASTQTTAAINANSGRTKLTLYPGAVGVVASWTMLSGGYRSSDGRQHQYVSEGFFNAGTGIKNALKFFASAGNITRAFLTVKGIV
jgi:hypothetical protein